MSTDNDQEIVSLTVGGKIIEGWEFCAGGPVALSVSPPILTWG